MIKHITITGYDYAVELRGSGRPIWVALHGFLGSAADFAEITFPGTVIIPNLLGFAQTDQLVAAKRFTAEQQVADLHTLIHAITDEPVRLLGYSMGGRLALQYALTYPTDLTSLWLESSTAGVSDTAARLARQQSDHEKALRVEQQGMTKFIAAWEAMPLFASQTEVSTAQQAFMHAQRLHHLAANVANSLRYFGTGYQPNNWLRLNELTMPVHLITGERDVKFKAIADQMRPLIKMVNHVQVEGAGHNVHFERKAAYNQWLCQAD